MNKNMNLEWIVYRDDHADSEELLAYLNTDKGEEVARQRSNQLRWGEYFPLIPV